MTSDVTRVLLTTSDAVSQFREFAGLVARMKVVFLDRKFDCRIDPEEVVVWQGDGEVRFRPPFSLAYLPFRDVLERQSDCLTAIELKESADLLEDSLEILAAGVKTRPSDWRRAYSKSCLFRANQIVPGIVPKSSLVSGTDRSGRRTCLQDVVVKCGYGIGRPIEGLHPQVTFRPSGGELALGPPYRYLIQDYVDPVQEIRSYTTVSDEQTTSVLLLMPTGSPDAPDWRNVTDASSIRVCAVGDEEIEAASAQICKALNLGYVCLDFIRSPDGIHLIDINPHGSWFWLPEDERQLVDDLVTAWLTE